MCKRFSNLIKYSQRLCEKNKNTKNHKLIFYKQSLSSFMKMGFSFALLFFT